jgi:hypothetical protein
MNFQKNFLLLWVIFVLLDPDPLTRLNPDPIRIQIRNLVFRPPMGGSAIGRGAGGGYPIGEYGIGGGAPMGRGGGGGYPMGEYNSSLGEKPGKARFLVMILTVYCAFLSFCSIF